MNNKDCFFCKATIVSVEDWEKGASASGAAAAAATTTTTTTSTSSAA